MSRALAPVAVLRFVGALSLGLACASCSEAYVARRDALAPGAGDAIKGNVAIQVINPAPRWADETRLTTSGIVVQHAIEQYRNPSTTGAPTAPPVPTAGVTAIR